MRLKNLEIQPGFYYELFLTKSSSDLLPAPYVTDCLKYAQKYQKYYDTSSTDDESEDMIYKYPLSKEDCIVGCMGINTVRRCQCWPPELPFVQAEKSKNVINWCDWDTADGFFNMTEKDGEVVSWFSYCFSAHEDFCNSFCKLDCKTDRYSITKETKVWPAVERIDHSHNRLELIEESKCCAVISIRFWATEHTVYKYAPKFEVRPFQDIVFYEILNSLFYSPLNLCLISAAWSASGLDFRCLPFSTSWRRLSRRCGLCEVVIWCRSAGASQLFCLMSCDE